MYVVDTPNGVCLKLELAGHEVSVAFEQSRVPGIYFKAEISVFRDGADVTAAFSNGAPYLCDGEALVSVLARIAEKVEA